MQLKTVCSLVAAICAAALGGGCASIVHGGDRTLSIRSEPSGAKATIRTMDGEFVSITKTPCLVQLDPKRGYFKGQSYELTLELPGYRTAEVELRPQLSGWYFGNIVFGGLIGMLAVDPVTGSMWNIAPDKIDQKLSPAQAAVIRSGNGFVVVLASELTVGERTHRVRIN